MSRQSPERRIETLQKILTHEARTGFQDRAVTGGIARFITQFVTDMAQQAAPNHAALASRLQSIFAGYGQLSPTERQHRIGQAEAVLNGRVTASAPKGAAPAVTRESPTASAPAGRPRVRPQRSQAPTKRFASLDEPVTILPRVGAARAKQLEAIGVRTIRDLLNLIPRRYKDYAQVQAVASVLFQRECTIIGKVVSITSDRTQRGKTLVTAEIADATGRIRATWFNPYLTKQLPPGTQVAISGRVDQQRGILCFRNPEWEILDAEMLNTGRIVPLYPLTRNLYQKQVRSLVSAALDGGRHLLVDPLPSEMRQRHGLLSLAEAIESIHFPTSQAMQQEARKRLAFDEFLTLQIGLVRRKLEWQSETGHAFDVEQPVLPRFLEQLPFQLTNAQAAALDEILRDMSSEKPMSRLLQGDVGSGKTVVAAASALVSIANGYQAAVLAPTEILAEQHARSLPRLFESLPEDIRPRVALLTGSTPAAERAQLDEQLRSGAVHLLVGTHAILQEYVSFQRLGLAIIDEQHRFGVVQRGTLREKGYNPDVLVMTATPIPRSLALVMHGDLDVSIIDELPPGRQAIETYSVDGTMRERAYRFVRQQIEDGHQAFMIFSLVEESEVIDARAATAEYERLSRDVFPDLRLGLLHGRLRPAEKDAVMSAFRDHEIDVLVSTSVVEVGIDVPNATVMVIEGADRFGLSQLHQFRGRVGRGAARSYCILIADDVSEDGRRRLEAIAGTQDGFRLAEIDLEIRGPGEFLGTRQSGLPDLKLASLADLSTLQAARDEAHQILAADAELQRPEHQPLREVVDRFWRTSAADIS